MDTKLKKNHIPWNKNSGITIECEVCKNEVWVQNHRIGRTKFCSKKCFYEGRKCTKLFEKGHKDFVPPEKRGHSKETIEKLRISQRKVNRREENSPCWKGGKKTERQKACAKWEYREWRRLIFERDGNKCVLCGSEECLETDHIKPWGLFPELRYQVDNGRVLCKKCHLSQPTHGLRGRRKA